MALKEIDMQIRSLALVQLAIYKKPEDRRLLHKILAENMSNLNCDCFGIMANYPDHEYFMLLEEYLRKFYRQMCRQGNDYVSNETGTCYLNTLAGYKTKESAAILEKIFFRKPFLPCHLPDSNMVRDNLYEAILNNACDHYKNMLPAAKARAEESKRMEIALDPIYIERDSVYIPPIRW